MRLIVYAFIFAVVFLIFKAFFLDSYIAEHYGDDANVTEANVTIPSPSPVQPEPEVIPQAPAENVSSMAPIKKETKQTPEDKKMPLDQLGDSLSKHIKL
jgi:hypothetical protein